MTIWSEKGKRGKEGKRVRKLRKEREGAEEIAGKSPLKKAEFLGPI